MCVSYCVFIDLVELSCRSSDNEVNSDLSLSF